MIHPLLQTARGMCSDEVPHVEIDKLLARAVEAAKDLEDRVAELEEAMASEARIIEAQTLDLKSLGKGRRGILVAQVMRMRRCALGGPGRISGYGGDRWRPRVQEDLDRLIAEEAVR